MSILFATTTLAAALAAPEIIVTAGLTPVPTDEAAVSATVIDAERIDALGAVGVTDFIRLAPGVSVATSGARGAQAQVRLRGAEANHTLLLIDGIAFNDPAAGNEARFETLAADGLGRIEVITGPQSALFGSEALGGVIALETPDPIGASAATLTGEYGSRESARGVASAAFGSDKAGVSATASWQREDGIDILGGGIGDRDGYETRTISLKAVARPGSDGELGIVGRYLRHESQFDGTDPVTFLRADTADATRTETKAVRAWGRLGLDPRAPLALLVEAQYLDSDNRNRDGATPLNDSQGDRFRVAGQVAARFDTGAVAHELVGRLEREDESFETSDVQYGGFTDQRRTRGRTAYVGQWRASLDILSADVAVRHDDFNRFADETTVRANLIVRPADRFALFAGYGEGIAQPTFFDLYGFFPGSFVGNPNLIPERSKGYEAGVRYRSPLLDLGVTAFSNRLRDEIVSVFDSTTFLSSAANATGKSKRRGVELTGEVRPIEGLRISANYTWLDAKDQQVAAGLQQREVRRPRHSGNLVADWTADRLTLGAALSYVGKRRDTDFDLFPAQTVVLDDYVLASARIAFRIAPALELFGRVENLGDANYQDVVGYNTPGRSIHGGVRVRFGA